MDEQSGSETPRGQINGGNIMTKAYELTNNNKKRREHQRNKIAADHEKSVKATKLKIDTLFNDRKTRVTKSQRVFWTRLQELNKKREDLEEMILATMKSIERETQNIHSEISAVLAGRISDIVNPEIDN